VSNLNKKIYGTIEGAHPYVYLDGIVLKRSWAGEVRNVSLLVAIGVNERGYREILGICEGAKEDKTGWSAFLKHLKERGLKGVRLITSDACIGLAESAAEFFLEAAWQRCVVHWYRNIFSHVPSTKVREIAAMLKAIHASEDLAAAREKAIRVIEKLRDDGSECNFLDNRKCRRKNTYSTPVLNHGAPQCLRNFVSATASKIARAASPAALSMSIGRSTSETMLSSFCSTTVSMRWPFRPTAFAKSQRGSHECRSCDLNRGGCLSRNAGNGP
jgi:Transposase, Mutator family